MGGAPHPFFKGKALGTRLAQSLLNESLVLRYSLHFVRITFCISVRFANRADHNFPICQAVCCVRIAKSGLLCDLFWWNNLPQNHRLSLDYKHIIRYSSNMCFFLGLTTNYSLKHNKHPLKPSLLSWRAFCLYFFYVFDS